MKISTKGQYALEAVVDLAVHSKMDLQSLNQISERLGLSKNYLEQLFGSLRKNGLVVSVRGAQGGYNLARPAREITAGQVIRAVEGSLAPVACLDDGKCQKECGDYNKCVTKDLWQTLMHEVNRVADGVSIEALADAFEMRQKPQDLDYMI